MRLLIALLLTAPLFAQSADLSVRLRAEVAGAASPARIPTGSRIQYTIEYVATSGAVLEIDVPGTPQSSDALCVQGRPIRCTFKPVTPLTGFVTIVVDVADAGTYTATATISGPAPDPNPSNDRAALTHEVLAMPSLAVVFGSLPFPLSPREAASFHVQAVNYSSVPATNVEVRIAVPQGGTITGWLVPFGEAACVLTGNVLSCTMERLEKGKPVLITARTTAPDRVEGSPFAVHASITANEPDLDPVDNARTVFVSMKKELLVTNANDSGAGSLRQAMLDANTLCLRRTPCVISFRIPPSGAGPIVIRPLTPLPELVGELKLDGATQTKAFGDTNETGPEIEIDGSLVTEGAGIRISPNCVGEIFDISVTGFPGPGIEVSRMPDDPNAREACYVNGPTIRVSIGRNHLTRNVRGLVVRAFYSEIFQNTLSHNLRAGLFVGDGDYAGIRGNFIEGNGASGIFLHVDGADVVANTIKGNAHWGIARTARGEVDVTGNYIHDNVHRALDVGLDGETPAGRPVLYWAIYDRSRRATIVRGRLDRDGPPMANYWLDLYASTALSGANEPEAEGLMLTERLSGGHVDFEIEIRGDLRGKWITAASTVRHVTGLSHPSQIPGDTSELSNAVYVAQ